MLEGGLLALQGRDFILQGGDQRPGGREIVDVDRAILSHADIIREGDRRYKTIRRLRDPFVPAAAPSLREVDPREQERQIGTAHLDRV